MVFISLASSFNQFGVGHVVYEVLAGCPTSLLQFLVLPGNKAVALTSKVVEDFCLQLWICIVECAEVIEASPFYPLAVDAFGEGFEEL